MPSLFSLLALFSVLLPAAGTVLADDALETQRQQMVAQIVKEVRNSEDILPSGELDPAVLEALSRVPRHVFVPEKHRPQAYRNRPLPIGYGQTISQPTVVAIMTDLMQLAPDHRVLEVGTGSGYQAAIMAELVEQVYTIEIIPELADRASADLARSGYDNVITRHGDGYFGWPEQAPFDAIMVTAAASHIPPPLLEQLKPGGRMVIPVGSRFMIQHLVRVNKDASGQITTEQLLPVRFVPLTGQH